MIIACPACATHHKLADDHATADNSLVKCASCGHSWLEARAVEIAGPTPAMTEKAASLSDLPEKNPTVENLPAEIISPDTEYEATRIARAIAEAERKARKARQLRSRKIRNWSFLAACALLPVATAAALPQPVARLLPGTIPIYQKIGYDINIRGLKFADIQSQYVLADGVRVLAIRGRVINISGHDNPLPAIRISLHDANGKQVYHWKLANIAKKPLAPGQAKSFLTRVASPPKNAGLIRLRFVTPRVRTH